MRARWPISAAAFALLAAPSWAEPVYDIDLYALLSGKCATLKIAGRDFACKAVAYFHSQQSRADFTVVLDDPVDASHIVSFSGENARREQDNLYELSVDRMLLKSKDRPKLDGVPVPSVESSAGTCRLVGNFCQPAGVQRFLRGYRRPGKEVRTAVRLRWRSDDAAKTPAGSAAERNPPRQPDRAARMPSQGRGRKDPARPHRLHHQVSRG
jgi:hypothetical protein